MLAAEFGLNLVFEFDDDGPKAKTCAGNFSMICFAFGARGVIVYIYKLIHMNATDVGENAHAA